MTDVVAQQRRTPLAVRLKEQIRSAGGAISVHDYMSACAQAYYDRGRVFGTSERRQIGSSVVDGSAVTP